ncbi:MAG: alpha/beta hydrolase [Deltaproteobacteria bacterium]|nr:alpha/beta hydrolase [Deltaproteobacteria bacterium]
MTRGKTGLYLLSLVWLLLIIDGCMFMRLSRDLKQVETKEAYIRGRVSYRADPNAPVLLLLITVDGGKKQIVDFSVMEAPGLYAFFVPRGTYYVAGFIDLNENMRGDYGEIYGVHGAPDPMVVEQPGMINGVDLSLDQVMREGEVDLSSWSHVNLEEASASSYISAAGVVADLDNRYFTPRYAERGLWEPYTTLKEVGIGLFFLEAYDPDKIPVLFVYGASGNVHNWRFLFDHMDRTRFQPWFFNYPSGLDLEFIGSALEGAIKWLHERYGYDTLFVVAHSMGGLVARYAILQNVYEDHQDYVRLFLTISTPWGGHRAAAQGVKYAPAVVPSWRDMAPGSAFLTHLYSRPLPPEIPHYLFFSYSGRSGMMDENNDGAVTLESQLDYRVQRHAQALDGFDEDHVQVLYSGDLVAVFNAALKERTDRITQGPLRQLFGFPKGGSQDAGLLETRDRWRKASH